MTRRRPTARPATVVKHPNYTAVFAEELIELGRTDQRIVGITAGMPTGTGMAKFAGGVPGPRLRRRHRRAARRDAGDRPGHGRDAPGRCALLDVPPARVRPDRPRRLPERPARALAVDRAGLVGEDGTSHQGMFTLPAQRQLPNLVIASPEGRAGAALARCGPRSRRTTRSRSTTRATPGSGCRPVEPAVLPVGQAETLREGRDLLFVGFGPIVARAVEAADALAARGLVDRRHQRPVRQAARPPAHPRRRPRQAARRDVRGERRHRWVRERRARARSRRRGWPTRPIARSPVRIDRHPGRPVRRPRLGRRPPPRPAARRRWARRARSARRSATDGVPRPDGVTPEVAAG